MSERKKKGSFGERCGHAVEQQTLSLHIFVITATFFILIYDLPQNCDTLSLSPDVSVHSPSLALSYSRSLSTVVGFGLCQIVSRRKEGRQNNKTS